ncbi:MAG: FAD-binding protein [Deltaproteobacteria bacterium]|nr:MAG: FAD-binding protein [Deltaproteobacteria bacterium]
MATDFVLVVEPLLEAIVALLVGNVPWEDESSETRLVAEAIGVEPRRVLEAELIKKSLDARHKRQVWRAVFRVEVEDEDEVLARMPGLRRWLDRDDLRYGRALPVPPAGSWPDTLRPIVVGAGPAGLFAALAFAEAGAPVVLLERGGAVGDRVKAVNGHWRGKLELDGENNLLFGEGGAGTFSDGKIYTRRRDGEIGYILRRLVDFGADPEILTDALAHLGTDRVRALLPVFRQRLVDLGADVRFGARVGRILVEEGRAVGVRLADGETLRGGPVFMAAGHSARDTAKMLIDAGVDAVARPIAIGARIEHPQALVDRGLYGQERGELPPASYRLAHNPEGARKAHTFCMCPGGMVVPASERDDRVVVNGMSFAARRSYWANSAVIAEVTVEDYGSEDPLAGLAFQDAIEAKAYELAGSNGNAPAQRVDDFLAGRGAVSELPKTSFPLGVTPVDLRELLPAPVVEGMVAAILAFDDKIPGFAGSEGVLIAPETRTTSPVRYLRDEHQCSTTVADLYPVGEGAGYGGGIVSSAIDGLRAARGVVLRVLEAQELG